MRLLIITLLFATTLKAQEHNLQYNIRMANDISILTASIGMTAAVLTLHGRKHGSVDVSGGYQIAAGYFTGALIAWGIKSRMERRLQKYGNTNADAKENH